MLLRLKLAVGTLVLLIAGGLVYTKIGPQIGETIRGRDQHHVHFDVWWDEGHGGVDPDDILVTYGVIGTPGNQHPAGRNPWHADMVWNGEGQVFVNARDRRGVDIFQIYGCKLFVDNALEDMHQDTPGQVSCFSRPR